MSEDDARGKSDRRQAEESCPPGGKPRTGERRQPVADLTDAALRAAYDETNGEGLRTLDLLAEMARREIRT
jgi:hypothetical protein